MAILGIYLLADSLRDDIFYKDNGLPSPFVGGIQKYYRVK